MRMDRDRGDCLLGRSLMVLVTKCICLRWRRGLKHRVSTAPEGRISGFDGVVEIWIGRRGRGRER